MESRVNGKERENGQERVRMGRGLRKEAEEKMLDSHQRSWRFS